MMRVDEILTGNFLGFMELSEFFRKATAEQKAEYDRIVGEKGYKAAWPYVLSVLGLDTSVPAPT